MKDEDSDWMLKKNEDIVIVKIFIQKNSWLYPQPISGNWLDFNYSLTIFPTLKLTYETKWFAFSIKYLLTTITFIS